MFLISIQLNQSFEYLIQSEGVFKLDLSSLSDSYQVLITETLLTLYVVENSKCIDYFKYN